MYAIYKRNSRISNEDEEENGRKHVIVMKEEKEEEEDEKSIMNSEESEANYCSGGNEEYFAMALEATSDDGANESDTKSHVSKVAVYDDTHQLEKQKKVATFLCIFEAFMCLFDLLDLL